MNISASFVLVFFAPGVWKEPRCCCFRLLQLENDLICTFLVVISRPVESILVQLCCSGAALALRGRCSLQRFNDESQHVHADVIVFFFSNCETSPDGRREKTEQQHRRSGRNLQLPNEVCE